MLRLETEHGECSPSASPEVTPMSMTGAPGDNRLIVIILRGGMDGLSVVQPYGDPDFLAARGDLAVQDSRGAIDLDGYFALHRSLAPLMDLWGAGELSFAHAVSTPYRDKRSHFDGQDLLEAGTVSLVGAHERDGWLNRLLGQMGTVHAETAYALGRNSMPILSGKVAHALWSPSADLVLPKATLEKLHGLMQSHPDFAAALDKAVHLADVAPKGSDLPHSAVRHGLMAQITANRDTEAIARFAAERLRDQSRIASFSITGWDTHATQTNALSKMLEKLAATLLTLKKALGDVWGRTTVLAVTEFGRTMRMNGTFGTDHGTAGAMLLAGGALKGGQVICDWPGLAEADLYDRRDLNPTRDVRSLIGWVIRHLYGFDKATLQDIIFPGMHLGDDPGLIA